MQKKIDHFL